MAIFLTFENRATDLFVHNLIRKDICTIIG